jgi:BirA family biotin operon repressor/biotin-[acetyl-CoA-carboxylase] ligase
VTDQVEPSQANTSGDTPAGASAASEPAAPPEAPLGSREIRRYQAAVSVGAMALGWANLEKAPSGAAVVVDHEVSPLGRLGQPWLVPATSTLAFAVVLRPRLSAEEADVPWLIAALAVADGIEAADERPTRAAWPDQVVDEDGALRAQIRCDVQLGPGKVRVAVASVRLDVTDGPDPERRERLLTAVCEQLDRRTAELAEGVAGPLAAYEKRCSTLGHNLKLRLVPRGELRGHAVAIDPLGRLELRSATGMVERVSVNMVRALEVLA